MAEDDLSPAETFDPEPLPPDLDPEEATEPPSCGLPWYMGALGLAMAVMVISPLLISLAVKDANLLHLTLWSAFYIQGLVPIVILITMAVKTPRPFWRQELFLDAPLDTSRLADALRWTLIVVPSILALNAIIYLISKAVGYEPEPHLVLELLSDASLGVRLALVLIAVVLAPLAEELLFRVVLYRSLHHLFGTMTAMIITSFIFASIHLMPAFIVPLFFLGMVLQHRLLRTRSLWVPILIHAGFNGIMVVLALLAAAAS